MNRICLVRKGEEVLAYLVQSQTGLYRVNQRGVTFLEPSEHSRPRRVQGAIVTWTVGNTDPAYFEMLQSESGQVSFERQPDLPGDPGQVAARLQKLLPGC